VQKIDSALCIGCAPAASLQAMSPQLKLGILQLGPARFFRMAYLMHTGQQECGTFGQYLRASHPTFDRLFPGYADWLDRYETGPTY
jgi:hypothetical protein